MVEKESMPFAVTAFIIPNAPILKGKQLTDFIPPLSLLEKKLHYELFPRIRKENLQCLLHVENCMFVTDDNTDLKPFTRNVTNATNVKELLNHSK